MSIYFFYVRRTEMWIPTKYTHYMMEVHDN